MHKKKKEKKWWESLRKPTAPPEKTHKTKKDYKRKPKHFKGWNNEEDY